MGNVEDGFQVTEGNTSHQTNNGQCFTLQTPQRDYNLSATTENERQTWIKELDAVIARPTSEKEKDAGNV
jgi:hypothetical protein